MLSIISKVFLNYCMLFGLQDFFNITYRQHVTFWIFQKTESPHVPGPGQEETCEHTSSTIAILRHFAASSSAPSNGHYQKLDTKRNKLIWTSK